MKRIYVGDGGSFVWQWQPKEHIVLEDYPDGVFVRYANCDTVEAPVVQTRREGDKLVADIPPELMQVDKDITVYVCNEDGIIHCHFLSVISSPKPSSYVYEPVEVLRYESLAERIRLIEEWIAAGGSGPGGGIQEEKDPTVPEWAKQPQKPVYTAQEVGALPAGTKIPAKTSDLTNDSGFINKSVADLVNYYTKQQTEELIAQIPKFRIVVVEQLPTMGEERVLYLVPFATDEGQYLEYIWVAGRFEVIGSQRVNLTGYATENWVAAGYQVKGDYLTEDDIGTIADAVKKEVPLVKVAKAPVFVSSKDEMTDTGEVYVLVPDGFLWAYMAVHSVELGAELFEIGGIKGDDGTDAGVDVTLNRIRTAQIPCRTDAPISIVCNSKAKWLVHFYREGVWLGKTFFESTSCDNIVQLYSQPDDVTHVRLLLAYTSDANVTDIPDLLSNVTITQQASGLAWCNTGMAYNQPVDYEDRILAMEAELEALVNGTF